MTTLFGVAATVLIPIAAGIGSDVYPQYRASNGDGGRCRRSLRSPGRATVRTRDGQDAADVAGSSRQQARRTTVGLVAFLVAVGPVVAVVRQ